MLSNEFDVSFNPNFGKYDNNPMSGYGHNSSSLIDSVWNFNILTSHKRTHNGENPYNCQKTFAYLAALNTHKQSHTGERPFKCAFSKKTFKQIADLTSHWRSHTGEKPFKCDLCEKAFRQWAYLTRHKLSHSGEM